MLLRELGADVVSINCDPDGFNINENCAVLKNELFDEYVKEHDVDYCVAVDGDGDRLILSDGEGRVMSGDDILYVLAARNKIQGKESSEKVVGTEMTNQGTIDALKKIDIECIRTKVGDKFISRELVKNDLNLGTEPSGHIIQREFSESGDANIALIQTLSALSELDLNVKDIHSKIDYRPQALMNFEVEDLALIESNEFCSDLEKLKNDHPDARISIRKSGTQPIIRAMVEAQTDSDKEAIFSKIESLIK